MKLKWLDTVPNSPTGTTFGIPWKKGEMSKEQIEKGFSINRTQLQSWPTAYWPDGSIKWTAHAGLLQHEESLQMITLKESQEIPDPILIKETNRHLEINNGLMTVMFNKNGPVLIENITDAASNQLAEAGRLIAIIQTIQDSQAYTTYTDTTLETYIQSVSIERKGPLMVTVFIKGHLGEEQQIPFEVRFKIYKNDPTLSFVVTHGFNIEPEDSRIKGLGMELTTKLKGKAYNRQIRLTSGGQVYNEAAQHLVTRRYRSSAIYKNQLNGSMTSHTDETAQIIQDASTNALWDDFSFYQNTAHSGMYRKRTSDQSAWLTIPIVEQSDGLLYAGGEEGGLAIGLRHLAEKFPGELSFQGVGSNQTKATIWFWSPQHEPMDLRHYDQKTHVDSAYEGFPEMRATPIGIANTEEATIRLFNQVPSNEALVAVAQYLNKPPLLITHPEVYYESGATGEWRPIRKQSKKDIFIEQQLQNLLTFYLKEIEQRNWKGYWNYGDIMHSYDADRHQWFYDLGGYAWQNTELVPNLWFWYSFFRTTDSKIFRMAEAMTRHTSEVDRYHFGEYAGLGSRHNVSHWGCGCKEARISMACLQKYYYYLTGDERTASLLDETINADKALESLDPMREFYEKPSESGLTHARLGPDWSAFCSNWMSSWERNKDQEAHKKIEKGLEAIKNSPYRLLSGPTFEYDTHTQELIYIGTPDEGAYHMEIAFGAPQVWIELANLLNDTSFKDMIAEIGQAYAMNEDQLLETYDSAIKPHKFSWPMFSAGLVAYAATRTNQTDLVKIADQYLFDEKISGVKLPIEVNQIEKWKTIKEVPWLTTNVAAQWSLNVLMFMKYAKEF